MADVVVLRNCFDQVVRICRVCLMLRPVSWISRAGVSPVQVVIGRHGSRPRFVIVGWRVERGVKSLVFVGSDHVGGSAIWCESLQPRQSYSGEAEPFISR
jgi:hypothetical protein